MTPENIIVALARSLKSVLSLTIYQQRELSFVPFRSFRLSSSLYRSLLPRTSDPVSFSVVSFFAYSSQAHCSIVSRGKNSLGKRREKTIEKGAWIARLGRATTFLIDDRLHLRIEPFGARSNETPTHPLSRLYSLAIPSPTVFSPWENYFRETDRLVRKTTKFVSMIFLSDNVFW